MTWCDILHPVRTEPGLTTQILEILELAGDACGRRGRAALDHPRAGGAVRACRSASWCSSKPAAATSRSSDSRTSPARSTIPTADLLNDDDYPDAPRVVGAARAARRQARRRSAGSSRGACASGSSSWIAASRRRPTCRWLSSFRSTARTITGGWSARRSPPSSTERRPMVLGHRAAGSSRRPETYALLKKSAVTVWLRAEPEDHWNRVVQPGRSPSDGGSSAGDGRPARAALRGARAALRRRRQDGVDTSGRMVSIEIVNEIASTAYQQIRGASRPRLPPTASLARRFAGSLRLARFALRSLALPYRNSACRTGGIVTRRAIPAAAGTAWPTGIRRRPAIRARSTRGPPFASRSAPRSAR